MPRIPVVEAPQASPGGTPTPYANPTAARGSFGDAEAAGVDALAQGVRQAGAEMEKVQAEDDAAEVEKNLATYGTYANKATLAYRAQKGEKARESYEVARKDLEDQRAAMLEQLQSDRQRRVFALRSQLMLHQAYRDIEGHRTEQDEYVRDQASAAHEQTTLDTLKIHANDTDVFAPEGTVKRTIDTYIGTSLAKELDRKGVSQDEVEVEDPADPTKKIKTTARDVAVQQWRRKAFAAVMESLVHPPDGRGPDPRRVNDFFLQHRKDLGPDAAKHYAPIVHDIGVRQSAEDAVSAALKQSSSVVVLPDGTPSRRVDTAAFEDAVETGAGLSAEAKERARAVSKTVADNYNKQWDKTVDRVFTSGFSAYLRAPVSGKAGLANIDSATKAWLVEHAPEEWQKLLDRAQKDDEAKLRSANEHRTLREKDQPSQDQKRAFVSFVMDVKSNPLKYGSQSYDEGTFDREWGHRLHRRDYDKAIEKLGEAKGVANTAAGKELPQDVDRYILETGGPRGAKYWMSLEPKKWTDEQADIYYEFRARLQDAVSAEIRSGRKPDDKWFKAWVDDEMKTVVKVPGDYWGERWPEETTKFQAERAGKKVLSTVKVRGKTVDANAPEEPRRAVLLPPGVPAEFAAEAQSQAGGPLTTAQLQKLWDLNKSTWKGKK